MKQLLGLLTVLMLTSTAMAGDASVSSNSNGALSWVVVDEEIWVCEIVSSNPIGAKCYRAEMIARIDLRELYE